MNRFWNCAIRKRNLAAKNIDQFTDMKRIALVPIIVGFLPFVGCTLSDKINKQLPLSSEDLNKKICPFSWLNIVPFQFIRGEPWLTILPELEVFSFRSPVTLINALPELVKSIVISRH